jgi:hypothetical protein
VETAGQSTEGSLVRLAGILDGRKFRDAVLQQRDLVVGSEEDRQTQLGVIPALASAAVDTAAGADLLRAIYGSLQRIEKLLENQRL